MDVAIDLMFLIMPITITERQRIKLSANELVQIILMPTLSLFSKLRSLLLASLNYNAERILVRKKEELSKRNNRSRRSAYSLDYYEKIVILQNENFPLNSKLTVFVASLMYSLLLLIVIVIQSTRYPKTGELCNTMLYPHSDIVWKIGCISKVAFCKNMFEPSCNCASIQIFEHNLTELPNGTAKLTNLRSITVRDGPLKHLPDNLDALIELTFIDFAFNNLDAFDVDVGKLKNPRINKKNTKLIMTAG